MNVTEITEHSPKGVKRRFEVNRPDGKYVVDRLYDGGWVVIRYPPDGGPSEELGPNSVGMDFARRAAAWAAVEDYMATFDPAEVAQVDAENAANHKRKAERLEAVHLDSIQQVNALRKWLRDNDAKAEAIQRENATLIAQIEAYEAVIAKIEKD